METARVAAFRDFGLIWFGGNLMGSRGIETCKSIRAEIVISVFSAVLYIMDNVALFFFCFGAGSLVCLVWCIADICIILAIDDSCFVFAHTSILN
jgi:hypothetical protein